MGSTDTWGQAIRNGLVSGAVASIASTISLSLLGKTELNRSAAPINGPSQWIWGRHAPYENCFSLRYTIVGYAIHHAASVFWAIGYERLRKRLPAPEMPSAVVASAIVTATAAYTVDFHLTPKRLTPGFENRLSERSLLLVYGTFALGLAASALLDCYRTPRTRLNRKESRFPRLRR
ncbi:MAG: hypothetical protein H0X43_12550 [Nitrosospira sp.]|nr:hypothetical protein [Nitrosospira sp.]